MTEGRFKTPRAALADYCKSIGIKFYLLKNSNADYLRELHKKAKYSIRNDDVDVLLGQIPIFENMLVLGNPILPERSKILEFLKYLNNSKRVPHDLLEEFAISDEEFIGEGNFIFVMVMQLS